MGKERKNYKIGLYLEKALDDKKITTKELADLTGIEVSLLRRYYINEKSPSLTNIEKIANALDKDVEYFTSDHYFKSKDTFNKLGYKDKINTHTTSYIN